MELIRAVSRFDVYNEAAGYELVSASIWNAYTASFIWEGSFTDFTQPRTERYYGVGVNDNKEIVGSLYAFENYVSSPEQKDNVTTCLIVGLKNLTSGKTKYFRTNVNVSRINGHQLKRNNVYTTIVKSVRGEGDETEREAYENSDMLLEIDVHSWILDDSGIIQIEGENVLAIPTSKAKLFAQGDTREYYVYTIGQGVPSIKSKNLPGHIQATLKLAPGYSENANFKTSILTFEAASGTTDNDIYHIELSFSTLSASIVVEQEGGNADYVNLDSYAMIQLQGFAGDVSRVVKVTSSDNWVAEIAYGNYFSFIPGSVQSRIEGASGGHFTIYTAQDNFAGGVRYCFVKIYLADKPEISRVIVMEQKGENLGEHYLFITPNTFEDMPASGGSTAPITIYSSGAWKGEVIAYENAAAFFEDYPKPVAPNLKESLTGQSGNSFVITFNSLVDDLLKPGYVRFRFTLESNPSVEQTVTIHQQPITETTPVVHVMLDNVPGALYHMDREYVYDYVYQMATDLRKTTVIGNRTIEPFAFINRGSYRDGSILKYRPFSKQVFFRCQRTLVLLIVEIIFYLG
ncbi:MAG: hypothetical protein LUG51_10735 [Tannerellaceae bacterium]|nr:hypothetical protein [Tannerellaceae bacterium]